MQNGVRHFRRSRWRSRSKSGSRRFLSSFLAAPRCAPPGSDGRGRNGVVMARSSAASRRAPVSGAFDTVDSSRLPPGPGTTFIVRLHWKNCELVRGRPPRFRRGESPGDAELGVSGRLLGQPLRPGDLAVHGLRGGGEGSPAPREPPFIAAARRRRQSHEVGARSFGSETSTLRDWRGSRRRASELPSSSDEATLSRKWPVHRGRRGGRPNRRVAGPRGEPARPRQPASLRTRTPRQ